MKINLLNNCLDGNGSKLHEDKVSRRDKIARRQICTRLQNFTSDNFAQNHNFSNYSFTKNGDGMKDLFIFCKHKFKPLQ